MILKLTSFLLLSPLPSSPVGGDGPVSRRHGDPVGPGNSLTHTLSLPLSHNTSCCVDCIAFKAHQCVCISLNGRAQVRVEYTFGGVWVSGWVESVSSEEPHQVPHVSGQVHHEGVQGHQQENGDHYVWG